MLIIFYCVLFGNIKNSITVEQTLQESPCSSLKGRPQTMKPGKNAAGLITPSKVKTAAPQDRLNAGLKIARLEPPKECKSTTVITVTQSQFYDKILGAKAHGLPAI